MKTAYAAHLIAWAQARLDELAQYEWDEDFVGCLLYQHRLRAFQDWLVAKSTGLDIEAGIVIVTI